MESPETFIKAKPFILRHKYRAVKPTGGHKMRTLKTLLLMTLFGFFGNAQTVLPNESLYNIEIKGINGEVLELEQYKGKKILFVNVASECGFTKQYDGLQELYPKYQDKLVIIGLPCNQFGGQEQGVRSEIESFCKLNYGENFPMTEKIEVKGKKNSTLKWNFQKYLVDEQGKLINVFYSITKPMSSKITQLL